MAKKKIAELQKLKSEFEALELEVLRLQALCEEARLNAYALDNSFVDAVLKRDAFMSYNQEEIDSIKNVENEIYSQWLVDKKIVNANLKDSILSILKSDKLDIDFEDKKVTKRFLLQQLLGPKSVMPES